MKPMWMDEKVTAAVKRKTEAYTKYRQSREGTDYINYSRSANMVKAEVRKAVRTFEKRFATEAKKNAKAFFNYARSKMKTSTAVIDLEYPDGCMAHTYAENDELPIDDDMVAAVLDRLIPNKSPGGDGRHPRLLVELKNEIATPLMMMFTHLLLEGQLPPSRKKLASPRSTRKANVTSQGTTYRPVSLIYMAGTCVERLLQDAAMTHMTENDLLSPKQNGFVQG